MDDFKAICKILSALRKAMDISDFDASPISSDSIGVPRERWNRYMEMLIDE